VHLARYGLDDRKRDGQVSDAVKKETQCGGFFTFILSSRTTRSGVGLVSLGAATDGCHPIFSRKNLTTSF